MSSFSFKNKEDIKNALVKEVSKLNLGEGKQTGQKEEVQINLQWKEKA